MSHVSGQKAFEQARPSMIGAACVAAETGTHEKRARWIAACPSDRRRERPLTGAFSARRDKALVTVVDPNWSIQGTTYSLAQRSFVDVVYLHAAPHMRACLEELLMRLACLVGVMGCPCLEAKNHAVVVAGIDDGPVCRRRLADTPVKDVRIKGQRCEPPLELGTFLVADGFPEPKKDRVTMQTNLPCSAASTFFDTQ